jgi:hypothetical protein
VNHKKTGLARKFSEKSGFLAKFTVFGVFKPPENKNKQFRRAQRLDNTADLIAGLNCRARRRGPPRYTEKKADDFLA